MTSIYDFSINSLQGETIDFSSYKGKILLLVNTASKCGLTPQYEGLQALHKKYSDQGLVIMGFPCNQFGNQEPGDEKSISEGCLINYGVDFTITEKVNVNGENSHPLFRYLRESMPGIFGNKIKWNFTKFMIDQNGNPLRRFAPITKPQKLERYIKRSLKG
ncbi:glutathione peroxidase [Teredinibacter haidensis]|uniref:glutathione peroxidase n=1 Tax=Teredinibacter haidensis TaxID=2731755 RepID=UPI000948D7BF|nr:glutathione peroxidase [Teredinibacter haidensis]